MFRRVQRARRDPRLNDDECIRECHEGAVAREIAPTLRRLTFRKWPNEHAVFGRDLLVEIRMSRGGDVVAARWKNRPRAPARRERAAVRGRVDADGAARCDHDAGCRTLPREFVCKTLRIWRRMPRSNDGDDRARPEVAAQCDLGERRIELREAEGVARIAQGE